MVDVEGDDHYGFCDVSSLLGLSVDTHHVIHLDLMRELNNDYECYLRLLGTNNRFREVKHPLTIGGIGLALRDKWMIMPDMSFLTALKYKYEVVLLSETRHSKTFSPLCVAPSESN